MLFSLKKFEKCQLIKQSFARLIKFSNITSGNSLKKLIAFSEQMQAIRINKHIKK